MPTTRHQAQATPPESQQHSSTNNPSDSESPKVTRSGREIQRRNQDSANSNPRSAKRRRTESSTSLDDADISVAKTTDQLSLKDRIERAANTALEQGRAQDVTDRTNEHVPDGNRVYVSRSDVSNGGTLRTAKPTSWMKRESLPVLDILATQILSAHAKPTHQEVGATIADPTSVAGRSYVQAQSDFARTKQLYGGAALFLRQSDGDLQEPTHTEILRKANLATFISSIFTGHIGLEELDRHFLEVFVPEGGRLLKAQAALWLELKTQAFIASVVAPNKHPPSLVLSTLFNEGIERNILDRRPGAKGLAPSEQDFMERMASRRDFLAAEMSNEPASTLPGKYRWDDFLREITLYIGKTLESVNGVLDNEANVIRSTTLRQRPEMQRGEMEGSFSIHARPSESAVPPAKLPPTPNPQREDFVARAARAAHIALQGPGMAFPSPRPKPPSPIRFAHSPYQQVQPTFQHYTPPSASHGARSPNAPRLAPSDVPHSSQSAPTQVLYERARMATSAKASPSSKKAASASQRRPWTSEEEEALMEGLDRVRGPHWSQILTMFGAGGKENEKLKDRNQVQLKDKARNLKLFFLKSGIEVPFYLQYVTGDLKSRAPAQASKKERERLQGSEDPNISGVEGIVALAQGQEADESGLMAVDEGEASGD